MKKLRIVSALAGIAMLASVFSSCADSSPEDTTKHRSTQISKIILTTLSTHSRIFHITTMKM